jgi:uncharacterized protein YyaL (SSP411 family)
MLIAALAYAASHLPLEAGCLPLAESAADFILNNMYGDGGLQHTHRAGKSHIAGFLDDYACFADGLLELHATTAEKRWFEAAETLADAMQSRFEHNDGVYFYSANDPSLIVREKDFADNVTPSGNGMAARVLARLSRISPKRSAEFRIRTIALIVALKPAAKQSAMSTESLAMAEAILAE